MAEFDCEETKRHVHEYLHNELSEQELNDITGHLANCDSCEGDYDVENTINNAVSRACADVPPQVLADAIMGEFAIFKTEFRTSGIPKSVYSDNLFWDWNFQPFVPAAI